MSFVPQFEIFGGPVSRMQLDTVTWQRDSHELFDYESRSVERASFAMESSARVYRRGAQVFLGPDRDGGMLFSFCIPVVIIRYFRYSSWCRRGNYRVFATRSILGRSLYGVFSRASVGVNEFVTD